jgi:hypothetical protein
LSLFFCLLDFLVFFRIQQKESLQKFCFASQLVDGRKRLLKKKEEYKIDLSSTDDLVRNSSPSFLWLHSFQDLRSDNAHFLYLLQTRSAYFPLSPCPFPF